jgi:hypothetical protein
MSDAASSPPLPGIGISVDALIAMLKDTLTTDLIPNAKDRSGKAVYSWMYSFMEVIEKHKGTFNNTAGSRDKNLLFDSVKDEESARRWGEGMSKIDTILGTDCGLGGGWFKDSIASIVQLASAMDEEDRDLGKYIREGWNAYKASTGGENSL